MKRFNYIFLYLIHSFYYMLGSFLIFTYICDIILEKRNNFSLLLIFSLLFYFVIFIVLNMYETKKNIDLSENVRFLVIDVVACILAGIVCAFNQGFFMIIFTIAYYIIISMVALRTNRVNTSVYLKIVKSFGLIIVITAFYVNDKKIIAFGNRFVDFILIYFAVIVFYIVCINFNEHYESENSINKTKNLFVFNFLVAVITTIFIFFRQKVLNIIKIYFEFVQPAIDSFIEKFISAFTSLVERFFNTDFMVFVDDRIKQIKKQMGEKQTPLPELTEEKVLEKVGEVADFSVIYNILLILFILGLIYVLYKSLRGYKHKRTIKKSFEEREFIFKKDDLLNDLKNIYRNRFKKKEHLSKARLIYKNTVNKLIEDGYEISKITTPNEYIKKISTEDIIKYNFDKITSDYNTYRYGKDNT